MLLDAQTVQWVAIGAGAVAVVGFGTALGAALRLRRLRRAYAHVNEAAEGGGLLEQLAEQRAELAALRTRIGSLGTGLDAVRTDVSDAVRHVAVVRYDAFSDMGGRLSYSAALLDDAGDGVVLTSINGRSEARSYAKGVKTGDSDAPLSPEEQQAIGFALRGTGITPAGARSR